VAVGPRLVRPSDLGIRSRRHPSRARTSPYVAAAMKGSQGNVTDYSPGSEALSSGPTDWSICATLGLELCFRDIKTTMGMEYLRCKSPEMARKELLAYLVAHNVIRCIIAEAVGCYDLQLQRVSFKGAVDAFRQTLF